MVRLVERSTLLVTHGHITVLRHYVSLANRKRDSEVRNNDSLYAQNRKRIMNIIYNYVKSCSVAYTVVHYRESCVEC